MMEAKSESEQEAMALEKIGCGGIRTLEPLRD